MTAFYPNRRLVRELSLTVGCTALRLFLLVLCDTRGGATSASTRQADYADEMGASTRSIIRAEAELVAAGFLTSRGGGGSSGRAGRELSIGPRVAEVIGGDCPIGIRGNGDVTGTVLVGKGDAPDTVSTGNDDTHVTQNGDNPDRALLMRDSSPSEKREGGATAAKTKAASDDRPNRKPKRRVDGKAELAAALELLEAELGVPLRPAITEAAQAYRSRRSDTRYPVWDRGQWLRNFRSAEGDQEALLRALEDAESAPYRKLFPKPQRSRGRGSSGGGYQSRSEKNREVLARYMARGASADSPSRPRAAEFEEIAPRSIAAGGQP